jgi:hypothetical protein
MSAIQQPNPSLKPTAMRRYDRSRFLAFGVLPAANAVGLLLYRLGLATFSCACPTAGVADGLL